MKDYKNLLLAENGVLFNTTTKKIFFLDEEHIDEFDKLIHGEIEENKSSYFEHIKEADQLSLIKTIKINLTNCCNLKCKYCFADEGTYGKKPRYFSEELIKPLLEFIKMFPTIQEITFFGGEPFLNYSVMEDLCSKIYKINPKIKFLAQTNGTIINDKILQIMNKYNVSLTVSIDGNQQDHDRNRIYKDGKGSYRVVKENFSYLQPYVSTIEATYDQYSEFTKREIEQELYDTFNIKNIVVADLFEKEEELELHNVNDELRAILNNDVIPLNLTRKILIVFFSGFVNPNFCFAGSEIINIDSDGEMYPCHMYIQNNIWSFGNLKEFDKQKFLRQREKFIRSCSKNENKKCSFCPIKWHCTKCTIKINNHSFGHCEVLKTEEFKRFDRIAEIIEEGKIEQYIHKLEGAYKYV